MRASRIEMLMSITAFLNLNLAHSFDACGIPIYTGSSDLTRDVLCNRPMEDRSYVDVP